MHDAEGLLKGLRMVVIDDNYLLATSVASVLEFAGGNVLATLPSLDDALHYFSAGPGVDAVVLDVDLAGSPSYPIAELLDQNGIPFLFVTGYDSHAIDERFRERMVCMKPVSPDLLCMAIARLCGRS